MGVTMPDYSDIAVGNVLYALRKDRKLSQDALSALSGITFYRYRRIELGLSIPTFKMLWQLAEALQIPLEELVGKIILQAEMIAEIRRTLFH